MYFQSTKVYSGSTKGYFQSTQMNFRNTKVYFQSTKVYSRSTKVYSPSTKVYFQSTSILSNYTSILSKNKSLLWKYKSILWSKNPKARLLRALFDSIDLLALFGVYAGIIFVLFTRYLRGSMNCTFVVWEFSVTPPEMIKKKLWEKTESSFFSLHLDFESVVVSS